MRAGGVLVGGENQGERPFRAHQEIDILYYVDKSLIFLVFYIASPPAYRAGHL